MLWWESLRRLCGRDLCPCCVGAGTRAYLRLLDNRCSVTQQLLSDVEAFCAFECVKCELKTSRRPACSARAREHLPLATVHASV
jgi:hypothetical protein